MDNQQPQQINIELGEKEADGVYSNLAIITHSNAEFVIDFTRVLPGVPRAKVHSRVIMTPQHAKLLLNAIKDNIEKFEKKFGEIKLQGEMPTPGGWCSRSSQTPDNRPQTTDQPTPDV